MLRTKLKQMTFSLSVVAFVLVISATVTAAYAKKGSAPGQNKLGVCHQNGDGGYDLLYLPMGAAYKHLEGHNDIWPTMVDGEDACIPPLPQPECDIGTTKVSILETMSMRVLEANPALGEDVISISFDKLVVNPSACLLNWLINSNLFPIATAHPVYQLPSDTPDKTGATNTYNACAKVLGCDELVP